MLFNSLAFLAFCLVFFSLRPLLRSSRRSRWTYLVCASLFFYGWWDWRFAFLLLASGTLDFFAALAMRRFLKWRRVLLISSLVCNLGVLATFKYLGFLTGAFNDLLAAGGLGLSVPEVSLVLPVAISFYTFQSMSYTIDVYRNKLEPTRDFLHFMAYLVMFPQLMAGPIIRARHMLPQLAEVPASRSHWKWRGLRLVVRGFFKKMFIADNLAPTVSAAFGTEVTAGSGIYWWLIAVMFALQVYCDFSGYSDIARGLAEWMGYRFPRNFRRPYSAQSLGDFWRRWHVSLSAWFRDYVYIPLGGNRGGRARAHLHMWLTMLLAGLWHGAAWTFLAWGALHAAFLSAERELKWPALLKRLGGLGRAVAVALVVTQVTVAFVLFRATSLEQAGRIMMAMFGAPLIWTAPASPIALRALIVLAAAATMGAVRRLGTPFLRRQAPAHRHVVEVLVVAGMAFVAIFFRGPGTAFIYFQF